MNKTELVEAIAKKADLSKKDAEAALKAFTDTVGAQLKKGDKIVSFDIEKIRSKGYDPTVMAIVSNTENYAGVSPAVKGRISVGQDAFYIKK